MGKYKDIGFWGTLWRALIMMGIIWAVAIAIVYIINAFN